MKASILHNSFALIKTIQYNNFCYESLITYYLYNFKIISEDSIYFGLILTLKLFYDIYIYFFFCLFKYVF